CASYYDNFWDSMDNW
nr:immunoglobulin heavy chain junction region [Mus musculus]